MAPGRSGGRRLRRGERPAARRSGGRLLKVADLRAGWRTEFILHAFGAQVIEHDDCIVVRTPANPTFYWGNCLVLPAAPLDGDLARWLARFDTEIARHQPNSQHVAIGIDAEPCGEALPSWHAAGFERRVTATLCLQPGELRAPAREARGRVQVRALDLERESGALIDLEATDAGPFEPVGYRAYLAQQHERYRTMHAAGQLEWFGAFCDGTLAASCGLMRDRAVPGATARFQRVLTHPAWRRRGLCSTLVHAVSAHAFGEWQATRAVMAADPAEVAIGIYRALGFRDIGTDWGLQRNAPQDR